MSVEQIERQIQQLSPSELLRLGEWFNGFLASRTPPGASPDPDWQETPELVDELERRLAECAANPAIAIPFEPDYFDNLKRQLVNERAQKASAR
jgi:hypothetical protein